MSNAYRLAGRGSVFQSIIRAIVLVAATIGGLFMLAFSAAVAFFVVIGILLFASVVFALFWVRAKILKRPFGPQAQFDAVRRDMETRFNAAQNREDMGDGPIIDARETPKGWSVND